MTFDIPGLKASPLIRRLAWAVLLAGLVAWGIWAGAFHEQPYAGDGPDSTRPAKLRIGQEQQQLSGTGAGLVSAAESVPSAEATDPVCGMTVDTEKAAAAGLKSTFGGTDYFFCSTGCKQKFDAQPERFLRKEPGGEESGA
ncbi:MAG: YHS domain-containing protein [bacterium]